MSRDRLASSHGAKALVRFSLDADVRRLDPHRSCQLGPHPIDVGSEPRALGYHGDIKILDDEAVPARGDAVVVLDRTGDDGELAVAQIMEVVDDPTRGRPVVDADAGMLLVRGVVVGVDVGNPPGLQELVDFRRVAATDQDQAVDAANKIVAVRARQAKF